MIRSGYSGVPGRDLITVKMVHSVIHTEKENSVEFIHDGRTRGYDREFRLEGGGGGRYG